MAQNLPIFLCDPRRRSGLSEVAAVSVLVAIGVLLAIVAGVALGSRIAPQSKTYGLSVYARIEPFANGAILSVSVTNVSNDRVRLSELRIVGEWSRSIGVDLKPSETFSESFKIPGIRPGEYILEARALTPDNQVIIQPAKLYLRG